MVVVDKKDDYRVLLTDTAPGDVPVIFSNDGLYINSHSVRVNHESTNHRVFKSFYEKILLSGKSQSFPYKYSIRKSEYSLRTLSLLHPRAQFNITKFYKKYCDAILYRCSLSPASIRAPYKVANSYFRKDIDKSSKYKQIDIDTLENELSRKHFSSYYSYRGHNRLYKLFDSEKYTTLEKRFTSFWMLDIANCFDSIYTHSISWAIKNKEFVKSNINYQNQFCNEFDQLIQRSNNNETNGIPIGAEISRIFAEIIFQVIDCNVINTIENMYGKIFEKDYVFYRYVDDYVIFARSREISSNVAKAISDNLSDYNLYINEGKLNTYERPFSTKKSNIINQAKKAIQEFEDKILDKSKLNDKRIIIPKKVNRKESLVKYFIGQIKYICSIKQSRYDEISSYLISTFSNRVIELISGYKRRQKEIDDVERLKYRDLLIVLSRLLFFFYTVQPQVSSSYKLAKTIIIIDRFFITKCPEFSDHFRTEIMENVNEVTFSAGVDTERSGFVDLEGLNVLLATSEFGNNYLVPEAKLKNFFNEVNQLSYFTIVSLLYYIRDHTEYRSIRSQLQQIIICKLGECDNLGKDSESLHLFLDSLSCPYLPLIFRAKILSKYLCNVEQWNDIKEEELNKALEMLQKSYWFIKWRNLDLIKLLKRKELNSAY